MAFLSPFPFCAISRRPPRRLGDADSTSKPAVVFAVLELQHTLPCWQCLGATRPPVTRPDDVQGPGPARPRWAADGLGPRGASASTHRAAPGWGTSRSRCTRGTERGCRGSRKTHSLHAGAGEKREPSVRSSSEKATGTVSPTNGGYLV